MKDTFTMKELAAILVRRGKMVLIFALVFAMLLGGWQGFRLIEDANAPKNSPEQIEARYQKALESYQEAKADLEKRLADKEALLEKQIAYNENSLLMKVDPLNKVTAQIVFMIAGLDNEELGGLFLSETTTMDYVIDRIQMQYAVYWQLVDLQEKLSGTLYSSSEEKYIREVVSFTTSKTGGGYITLSAISESEKTSEQILQKIYKMILEYQSTVAENSFDHRLSVIAQFTKTDIDEALAATQTANLEKVENYQTEIDTAKENLNKLKKPTKEEPVSIGTILIGTIKYMVLGAVFGVVLSAIWIILTYLFRNRVEMSRQLAQALAVPMLGSVSKRKGCFGRLADHMIGERVWKDETQALAYLSASALAHLPEKSTVALLSTLPICEDTSEIQSVLETLRSLGFQVLFAGDASHNSLAVSAVQKSDCVLLAESCGKSDWNVIQVVTMLAKEMETPIGGFVLV